MRTSSNLSAFLTQAHEIIPAERVLVDSLSRNVWAHDASHYLLIPQAVIRFSNEQELIALLQAASAHQIAVTFRAAGTSLSGQALSDSVLLVMTEEWRHYEILDQGGAIALQPGLRGSEANLFLAPFHRKIGPDPASIATAKIGGIAANNASGMCCGTHHNSYNTLLHMRIVFSDGSVLDTRDPDSILAFRQTHAPLLQALQDLHATIHADADLTTQIRQQFRIKNTVGYSLNAFLDFSDPIDIITHLMIGSEGTLGFISNITYRTVEAPQFEAAALAFYPSLEAACNAALLLQSTSVSALELMDGLALSTAIGNPHIVLPTGFTLEYAALLIDVKANTREALAQQMTTLTTIIDYSQPIHFTPFSTDRQSYYAAWDLRKGIFPAIAALRTPGSLMLNEDVAVHPSQLKDFCRDLRALFNTHGYEKASLFGHVKDGNLHFLAEEVFADAAAVHRYSKLMQDVAELVVNRYQGSLKAEHGTGRNIAPFLAMACGERIHQLCRQVKHLFDPQGILNPDVIITDDPELHLKNLKVIPAVDPLIDRCIECGFCERVCPSKNLTLTPRQRIVAWRNQLELQDQVDFNERVEQSCAATGLCSQSCPVGINTGLLVKQIRARQQTLARKTIAGWVARHYGLILKLAKPFTYWRSPRPAKQERKALRADGPFKRSIIYFESCPNRLFQPQHNAELLQTILRPLNIEVRIFNQPNSCCGLSFASKGFPELSEQKRAALQEALLAFSNQGQIPIVTDPASCIAQFNEHSALKMIDVISFLHQHLDQLPLQPLEQTVMLHIPCGNQMLRTHEALLAIAKRCARTVIVPTDITCCGFAGDKGFVYPQLNQSALKPLKPQVPADCQQGYSLHPTCQIGLTKASGIPYHSILQLVYPALA